MRTQPIGEAVKTMDDSDFYEYFKGTSLAIKVGSAYHVLNRGVFTGTVTILDWQDIGVYALAKNGSRVEYNNKWVCYARRNFSTARLMLVWTGSCFGLVFSPMLGTRHLKTDHNYELLSSGDFGQEKGWRPGYAFVPNWFDDIEYYSDSEILNFIYPSSNPCAEVTVSSGTLTGPLTNTCVKCGYHNEFMDPVPGYVCRQCKVRAEMWE